MTPEILVEPSDLDMSSTSIRLSITQLQDASKQRRLIHAWCDLLPTLTHVTELEFLSRVNQPLFEAACQMAQLNSLRIKWSGIKRLDSIANLTSLTSCSAHPCNESSCF